MKARMKPRALCGYGGFCDGRLSWTPNGPPAVFKTKKFAEIGYEDVRRIIIKEAPKRRTKHGRS